jgi:hypothetical protein
MDGFGVAMTGWELGWGWWRVVVDGGRGRDDVCGNSSHENSTLQNYIIIHRGVVVFFFFTFEEAILII